MTAGGTVSTPARRPLLHQEWRSLLFLHWACPSEELAGRLPAGLAVDTYEGRAYVGITALLMRRIRPVFCPSLPWISFFEELNVRTYVRGPGAIPGIWFFSLDCNRLLASLAGRLLGFPYRRARIAHGKRGRRGRWFEVWRAGAERAALFEWEAAGAEKTPRPDSLEFFLLERYFAYHRYGTSLRRTPVSHKPPAYQPVRLGRVSAEPLLWDGIGSAGRPVHACQVGRLAVETYAPEAALPGRFPALS
jgi:uncharacterized protein YqjF (DUF2071 family)